MAEALEATILQAFRRIARQLQGLQASEDTEALREALEVLRKQYDVMQTLYTPPPPPPMPVESDTNRLVTAMMRSRSRTFGSNF